MNPEQFASILLDWSSENQRNLPWKKDKDPYKIWISEIILQQTRVDQGTPYYLRFISTFPDIKSLASSNEDMVLKIWEGLGYYSRARNLLFTAKEVCKDYDGVFPAAYIDILKLKGIGPYTAAAIASFAFGLKHPVVDGNVLRFISRLLCIIEPIDINSTKRKIEHFLALSIQKVSPSLFNQALMDFGSAICTPSNAKCYICPFQAYCVAYLNESVSTIPYKSKKIVRKDRFFHYFEIVLPDGKILIGQRKNKDIWKGLYELPLLETDFQEIPELEMIKEYLNSILGISYFLPTPFESVYKDKQLLTHRNIYGIFYKITLDKHPEKINQDLYLVERAKVSNFAFPKIIAQYLKKVEI